MRKLQELSSSGTSNSTHGRGDDFLSFGAIDGGGNSTNSGNEDDFAKLVSGGGRGTKAANGTQSSELPGGLLGSQPGGGAPVFSWSTASTTLPIGRPPTSRTITPDFSALAASPNPTGVSNGSAPLTMPWHFQPAAGATSQFSSLKSPNTAPNSLANSWSASSAPLTTSTPTSSGNFQSYGVPTIPSISNTVASSRPATLPQSAAIYPPLQPSSNNTPYNSFSIPPPPSSSSMSIQPPPSFSSGINNAAKAFSPLPPPSQQQQKQQKQGLDKFESLL